MSTKTTSSATLSTSATISSAEVAYSQLSKGSYEVAGGSTSGDGIQARILCSPSGSNVYYQDTRLADGKLQIDMTKEVQYT